MATRRAGTSAAVAAGSPVNAPGIPATPGTVPTNADSVAVRSVFDWIRWSTGVRSRVLHRVSLFHMLTPSGHKAFAGSEVTIKR
jgi:hypothetical protein